MRKRASVLPVLATLVAATAAPASAQTHLSFSVGAGSLFSGVGFGLHVGDHHPGSAFVGLSLGLGWGGHYGASPYGIYSDAYDRWDYGYGSHRAWSSSSCWDYYGDSYWDPWDDWYWDCVAGGPYVYGSFRTRSWLGRSSWWGWPSTYVYWADPFATPWGPYWAYDPWGGYWGSSWSYGWNGWGYRPWSSWPYGSGRVRVVYSGGGFRDVVGRASPLARGGAWGGVGYKESPGNVAAATAKRRPSAGPAATGAPGRADAVAPRAGASRGGSGAVAPRAPSSRGGASAAAPRRPSDRAAPIGGSRGTGRTPAAAPRTPRAGAPRLAPARRRCAAGAPRPAPAHRRWGGAPGDRPPRARRRR